MPTPSEELGAIVARLEEAADRLKADAGPPPKPDRPVPVRERRLDEVLEGLERANVEVQRARARLTELEDRLRLYRAA